jgi:predicted AAA+ superfamily ATPase
LSNHYLRGHLFENLVIADVMKHVSYSENNFSLFFIRDKTGHEIDLMIKNGRMVCAEIKSGETFNPEYVKNLMYYKELLNPNELFLVFSGTYDLSFNDVKPINWQNTEVLFG